MATLVPSLVTLRAEFNRLFPGRDKASDGWIGDAAHSARDSDHNPDSRGLVHAIDVDVDLGSGAKMQDFVNHVVNRCRTGAEKRLTYVIYNRRIASASYSWTWRTYNGSSPHTEHAHFSASDSPSREQNTSSWHLEEVPVALTADDKKWIADLVDRTVAKYVGDVTPRWTTDGTRVPANDPNPKMFVSEGLFYTGATARRIENLVIEIADNLKK